MIVTKKTGLFIGIVIFILLLPFFLNFFIKPVSPLDAWRKVLGEPEYMKVDLKKPLRDQTRIVVINHRRFEIPLMYIDGQLRGKGEEQNGINLKYILPDFKTPFELKNKEEFYALFNDRQFAHMLILDASRKPEISKSVEALKRSGAMQNYVGKEYGLEKYSNPETPNGRRRDDMYLEIKDGVVVSYIMCSVEGYVPYPGCTHKFYDDGLRYSIYYNKKNYLETWKTRRESAINFINSFEIKNGEQK